MKAYVFSLAILFSLITYATVEGYTRVYIVAQDMFGDEEGKYFVERVPVIGCYGAANGPQLAQFVAEYKIPSNVGCGELGPAININALSCAEVVEAIESKDHLSFVKITLDISKCPDKNNSNFITMIRTAASKNFPLEKGEVALILKK